MKRYAFLFVAAVVLSLISVQGAFAQWTDPAPLNSDAGVEGSQDTLPHVATDGQGNWVAVFSGSGEGIEVSRSTDNGISWRQPAVIGGVGGYPKVATDGVGNWVAVWARAGIEVSRSTDNGITWTQPASISVDAGVDQGGPHVATDGAGNWVCVWMMASVGNVAARSTDNGATWTDPTPIRPDAATDDGIDWYPRVATDGAGNWVCVWAMGYYDLGGTIGNDWDILVARSTDNGATWTDLTALNANAATDSGGDAWPDLATDGAGNWVAVWRSEENLGGTIGTDRDILVACSTDDGATWTDPAPLNTNAATDSGEDELPQVTTDGAGNWVAVWQSRDDLGGTIGTDADILVAYSTDNGATWTAPTALNTNAATDSGADSEPFLATDGVGSWVAVWESDDDLGGTIGTDADILFSRGQFGGTEDTDGDGLPDDVETDTGIYVDETDTGTDPNDPDSDDDQMPDGWEVDNDLDPNDDTGDNGADGDPDGDGYTNLEEYDGGTDPQDENSVPGTTVTADFTATPTSGNSPLTVQFTDQSTGTVTSWEWSFGDGGTSTQQSPSYIYNTAGSFDVSLTVTGPAGSDTETKARYIRVTTEQPVTAHFIASPTSGTRPLAVDFTDQSSGTITSWEWDFGDGYPSTEEDPSHTYYFTGDFTASLTVSGTSGSDTVTAVINVDQAPPAEGLKYKAFIDDIKVIYTKPTCFACYNELSDTLLVAVWGDEPGALTVKAGEEASAYWGSACDIYIDAPDASLKKINLKGREEMDLYVCGQVDYVKNFVLKYGFVGDTGDYGEAFGLGSAADDPPKNVLIKWGATTASVLGLSYPDAPFDLAGELKSRPFVEPELADYDEDEEGAETKAAYTFEYGDVKVLYSLPGCEAFYNDADGTLTIQVTTSDGNLTVICGPEAHLEWGDRCDVYIDAPAASINTINLKGRLETQLHVCGEVSYVKNFKLKYGCVGDTEFYGEDYGLGCTSMALPNKIKIKWGWTTAPLLGVSY